MVSMAAATMKLAELFINEIIDFPFKVIKWLLRN
jgi:hypothetical protein